MNIIGISVRLPDHHTNFSFWHGLEAGESFTGELSEERWRLMSPRTRTLWGARQALHGMFLDDELDRLAQSGGTAASAFVLQLRDSLDARVNDVAPLSVDVRSCERRR